MLPLPIFFTTMKKKYISRSTISLNVYVPQTKSNVRVSFMPLSNGSSVYVTEDENIQYGLEHHYRFGSAFRLDSTYTATANVKKEEPKNDTPSVKVVKVASLPDAKDYLAERFGVSRTLLRSEKSIVEQAASHGIKFEGY